MFIKKARHRVFDYQPRYYDPSKDEAEKRKRKLGFRSNLTRNSNKKSLLMLLTMILFILYLFLNFSGIL
jgi:hypothetical protein